MVRRISSSWVPGRYESRWRALQGEVDGEHLCLTTHAGDQPPHLHGAQVTPAGVFLGW